MRSGGAKFRAVRAVGAKAVAFGCGIVLVVGLGGPAGGVDRAGARLWALTRTADGRLHVVHGVAAESAATDVRVGRGTTTVLAYEEDEPVHELDDPLRSQQWALDAVPFEAAWAATRGSGVTVAVVDSGVLGTHEDLIGSVLPGIDYVNGGDGRIDPAGHGTHVAGIIAAHVDNGVGIAGAAPGVKILPVRVLDSSGSGSSSNVAAGIIWAADHGARVINLSLGGGPSPGIEQAMQYALGKQSVVVAAGGNGYQTGNTPLYPGAYPEAIAVSAVDQSLQHASFSNTGSYIDLAAPGDSIWSAWGTGPTQYALASGTSMATPYVSAAAALVIAENPDLTAAKVTQILESTATDLGAPGRDDVYGNGLVNPRRAVLAAMPAPVNQGTKGTGYWVTSIDGRVSAFGDARSYGDLAGRRPSAPIVASAPTHDGGGYWLAGADGAVYAFGDARYFGSMAGRRLNGPVVAMAATPSGNGYILLGRDGGIFSFGDARFYGSTGGMRLNAPVLDLTVTPDGGGYWFVAADGGVFSFGDARFHGSTGNLQLAAPVRSMTAASNGAGYWLVADDGGIFAFGVPFVGSMPTIRALLALPYVSSVRMRALPSNDGYYLLGADGSVWAFGAARWFGSASGRWAVDLMQMP